MQTDFSSLRGGIAPPPCNTGVNYLSSAQIVPIWGIDWLRVSFPDSSVDDVTDCLLKNGFHPEPCKGKHGYNRGYGFRFDILSQGQPDAFIWWGGDAMKGKATLEVPATYAEAVFQAVSRLPVPFSVRRLDLRLDFDGVSFLSGQDAIVHTLENWPYAGVCPSHHKIDDMGQGTGSTLYVGRRDGECMIRWYEKGRQLRDKYRPDWCRFEVELKPKKHDRGLLFWDMLKNGLRDDLAGSGFSAAFLPFFAGADNVDKRIQVQPASPRSFDDRIASMVTQWGGLLGEMLERAGGDRAAVADVIYEAIAQRVRNQQLALNPVSGGDFDSSDIPY